MLNSFVKHTEYLENVSVIVEAIENFSDSLINDTLIISHVWFSVGFIRYSVS